MSAPKIVSIESALPHVTIHTGPESIEIIPVAFSKKWLEGRLVWMTWKETGMRLLQLSLKNGWLYKVSKCV